MLGERVMYLIQIDEYDYVNADCLESIEVTGDDIKFCLGDSNIFYVAVGYRESFLRDLAVYNTSMVEVRG